MRQAYKEAMAITDSLRKYAPSEPVAWDKYHCILDDLVVRVEELQDIIDDLEEERRWAAQQGIRGGI